VPERLGARSREAQMTTTRSAAVLAAAACLAVLTGCASHAAAPGAGATRSPSTSTTAPTSAPAGTPATTAPGGQASAPRCHTSQLSLAFTGLNAASGGQRGMSLILTNHSGRILPRLRISRTGLLRRPPDGHPPNLGEGIPCHGGATPGRQCAGPVDLAGEHGHRPGPVQSQHRARHPAR